MLCAPQTNSTTSNPRGNSAINANDTLAPQDLPASPTARLWRNRGFNILWAGQSLSAVGDSFALVALPLLVLQATGSVAQMGLVTGVNGVGGIIAGIFAGVIADRFDRRRLMILCDWSRFALYGVIPLWWALFGPAFWVIYVVVLLTSLFGMTFSVAYMTAINHLVEPDQFTYANARLQSTAAIANVIGPLLAGVISARFGPVAAIGADALTFAMSAASLMFIQMRKRDQPHASGEIESRMRELSAGLRFLWSDPTLRAMTWLNAIVSFLVGGALNLIIFHIKHDLAQNDSAVGLTLAIASIGAAIGAVIAPWLRRRFGFGPTWIPGLAICGLSIALSGPSPTIAFVAFFAAGFTAGDAVISVSQISLRQEFTPNYLLGRVTAAFWTTLFVPMSIGAAVSAGIAQHIGAPTTLASLGVGVVLMAVIGLFTPIRTRRPSLRILEEAPVDAPITAA